MRVRVNYGLFNVNAENQLFNRIFRLAGKGIGFVVRFAKQLGCQGGSQDPFYGRLARIFHELLSRDHEDRRATGQPQGVGSEAYLNGTSQGPTPEDARKDGHIRGRSK